MNNITIIYIIVVILVISEENGRTKRKVQYHAGYHEEQAKRYCHFGKVWSKGVLQGETPKLQVLRNSEKRTGIISSALMLGYSH